MKRMLAVFLLLAVPAVAQENRGAGRGGDGGAHGRSGSGPATAGGGGTASPAPARGGGNTSGGSGFAGSGGGRVSTPGRHDATGGSGVAISRGAERGRDAGGGSRRGESAASPATGGTTATTSPAAATGTRGAAREGGRRDAGTPDDGTGAVPRHARPRNGDEPVVGTAVPRGSVPATTDRGGTIVTGAFFPWWFGGAGYYGGYYGGYYDPWFGGYSGYDPQPPVFSGGFVDEGSLRLKIKPKQAEVYVDGYYVGIVDEFDGVFQKLHIESGTHRIEVRAPGYEPLTLDVRITPDHSTTYQGELRKIP